jgi:hypothetical protein
LGLLWSLLLVAGLTAAAPRVADRDVQAIADGFAGRRLVALESIIHAEPPDNLGGGFLADQIKALALLRQAELTGDHTQVPEANELLLRFCRQLEQPNWWGRINHGAP